MEVDANGAPVSPSRNPDPKPETTFEFYSDPLLMSGAFIDVDSEQTQMGTITESKTEQPSSFQNDRDTNFSGGSGRKGRRKAETVDLSNVFKEPIDWLPKGWKVEYRVRNTGASAGHVDKYFVDPVSGLQFRSRKEVNCFLETGKKRKPSTKQSTKNDDDIICSGSSNSQKRQKAKSNGSKSVPDFNDYDVPEKVTWILTDSKPFPQVWTPYINGEPIPEPIRQKWATEMDRLIGTNSDSKSYMS